MIDPPYIGLDPERVAFEQVCWARRQGMSPRDILLSIEMTWPGSCEPDWFICFRSIAAAWRRMHSAPVAPQQQEAVHVPA